jgi:hypothetical protein
MELIVGQNRLALGLRLNHGTCVANADVVARLYALDDQHPDLRMEVRAFYKTPDRSEQVPRFSSYADGTSASARGASKVEGLYTAQVLFDRLGPWGLEVLIAQDDRPVGASRCTVNVLVAPRTPTLHVSAL